MRPSIILGLGLAGLGLLVMSQSAPASPSPATPKPDKPKTPTKPSTGLGDVSVPLAIVQQVLSGAGDAEGQQVWLRDSGYPKTADALGKYLDGDIRVDELLLVASKEVQVKTSGPAKEKGSTSMDAYGQDIVQRGDPDEIYNYCITSKSIPLLKIAAVALAARGDLRAAEITQRLAELS